MSDLVKTLGIVFLLLFLALILRELGFKGARFITLIGTIGILAVSVSSMDGIFKLMGDISAGGYGEYVAAVMKIIGIGYVSGICSDVCIEFGELTLSNSVLLLGKVEMLAISAPCAISILERGVNLIQ